MLRSTVLCAALSASVGAVSVSVLAQPTAPLSGLMSKLAGDVPQGWSRNMDGSYKQAESGVLCPKSFKAFNFRSVQGPSKEDPNILGTCLYTGESGRIGSIRIRRYAADNDKGPLADNDKLLMAKDNAPPLLLHTGIDRVNGGGRATATVVRNGLLVDCSVWQPEHDIPKSGFLLYCTTIPS